MEAMRTTVREILRDQRRQWRNVVAGLDAEALNWKPGQDANSIAVLVAHTFDAERFLMAHVVGIRLDRDREARFRTVVSGPDELLTIIDGAEREVDGYVELMSGDALAADMPHATGPHLGAWWPLHALEHSREHLGQALLTRQMYEQGRR
jgi:hypothetical protein